jgi:hypothetical protein
MSVPLLASAAADVAVQQLSTLFRAVAIFAVLPTVRPFVGAGRYTISYRRSTFRRKKTSTRAPSVAARPANLKMPHKDEKNLTVLESIIVERFADRP